MGGGGGIGDVFSSGFGLIGSKMQSDAVEDAADTSAAAIKYGIDVQYKMWEKAYNDFLPYLESGIQGVSTLSQTMPQYLNNVLTPLAQEISSYQASSPIAPGSGMVNPVTGEITPITQLPQQQNQLATVQQPVGASADDGGNYLSSLSTPQATGTTSANGYSLTPAQSISSTPADGNHYYTEGPLKYEYKLEKDEFGNYIPPTEPVKPSQYQDSALLPGDPMYVEGEQVKNPFYNPANEAEYDQAMSQYYQDYGNYLKAVGAVGDETTGQTIQPTNVAFPTQTPTAGNQLTLPSYQTGATQQQLEQGGVLSPLVPELPGQIDFEWNPEDEVYKYKLGQAEDSQKRYLAALGMTNSSPALTKMRDTGLAVAAEDIDKQYARQQTERNYLAQKLMDEYNAKYQRGNTLYDRQQTAANTGLTQAENAISQYDANRLNQLMNAYNTYGNLYGLQYGNALDLAKMGAGAAGSAGSSSIQTGQGISNSSNQLGESQANAALAQGNIWANFMNGLQYNMNNLFNNTSASSTPSNNYSSYYNSPVWNNIDYSNTGSYVAM